MQASKKRMVFYGVVLVLLGVVAYWTFHEPEGLAELKETELVTEGTEEPIALVKKAVKAIDGKQRQKLFGMMATRDAIEFGRISEVVFGEAMSPVEVLGCRRLKKSSREGNLSVFVRSDSRKETYLFHVLKDKHGHFKLYDVEKTDEVPAKES